MTAEFSRCQFVGYIISISSLQCSSSGLGIDDHCFSIVISPDFAQKALDLHSLEKLPKYTGDSCVGPWTLQVNLTQIPYKLVERVQLQATNAGREVKL